MTTVATRSQRTGRRRRTGLAVVAAIHGAAAAAGAVGLVTGAADFGDEIDARLPFESLPFAGLALALLVAVPAFVLAVAAWRGDPRCEELAVVVGVALVGWIVVQLLFIRSFSWFQPFYVALGLGFAVHGRRTGGPCSQLIER